MVKGSGKILLICLMMCLATGITVWILLRAESKKMGVIDAVRLFNQYNMKKELEEKAKVRLQAMGKQADSVSNLLNMAKATKKEEEIKKLSYAVAYCKQSLEAAYQESNQEINTQVWKRLNPVLEAYGKAKGVHVIIGANGMGSILYNDDYYDLTNDAIKFINQKYEEGN